MNGTPPRMIPGLLFVVALLAGWRTVASTRQVLQGTNGTPPSSTKSAVLSEDDTDRKLLSRAAMDDSLLTALDKAGRLPDPFDPKPPEVAHTTITKPPEPPPVVVPTVAFAAVAAQRPEVILRIGGQESPRLRVGGVWQGWTVAKIDRNGVEVEGFGQKAHLRVPN